MNRLFLRLNAFTTVFILCLFLLVPRSAMAQLCTGSLGDAVVNINFGAGTSTFGPELANGITNYTYVARSFPQDGYYSILKTTAGSTNTWWTTTDHTGNTNGYMMLVNSSTSLTDYFYKETVGGLCGNTTYEFAAWIMNLLNITDVNPPNMTFSIERTTGEVLGTYTTGSIPTTSSPTWKQFGFFFTTPAGVTDVVVRLKNNSPGGSPANDLVLDDITFRPCGPIIEANIDVAGTPTTLNVCEGTATTHHLMATVSAGYTAPTYQWQLNTNGLGWIDIAGATSNSYLASQSAAGVYQYRLSVGEGAVSSNCRVVSAVLTLAVNALPVIAIASNSPLCLGEQLQLTASGGATYRWSGPDSYTSDLQNPVISQITLAQAGTYKVVVTTAAGCTSTASTTVAVGSRPAVIISSDVELCEGRSTILHASASGGVSYRWSPAAGLSDATSASPVASPEVTTTYTVAVSDQSSACPAYDSVKVTILKKAIVDAGPDKSLVRDNSVKLEGAVSGDKISYYWLPADYLDDARLLQPTATPDRDMTYTLYAISDSGCDYVLDEMNIKVYDKVLIPNTFSPNGDGINDIWNVKALDSYIHPTVAVFNRNGSLVYKSTGYKQPWDGTRNGSPLPVGTYYYSIDLKNNKPPLSGWIWLTR